MAIKLLSRPGYSKLTMLLVNVLLKFQTLISVAEIIQYFLLTICEKFLQCKSFSQLQSFSHFFNKKYQCKNISVFGYKVIKH